MYFFEKNESYKNRVHCIDDTGASYTYGQIWEIGDTAVSRIPRRSLVLLLAGNNVRSVSTYLALLRKSCPVILMGQHTDPVLIERMAGTYRPDYIAGEDGIREYAPQSDGGGADRQPLHGAGTGDTTIFRDLGLLLSTSGSTGAQKLVRLSYDNLQSNCDSIVEYLELTEKERPITTLPMEYTYGLSVIHSHTAVGASIILTDLTLFQPQFWELAEKQRATSMAGVPYTYEMLQRLRFQRMELPALTSMTQAGGHLKAELQESYAAWAKETGRRFFVMYGQTEATARMSYIPWEHCSEKIGSIGIPVPGGRIEILGDDGEVITKSGVSGELIYYGPNVSLGYATCRDDLARSDENGGRLQTGDMAYVDEEGYYFITGRKKRFVKLYGKRFSLDQIQDDLQEEFGTPDIVCTGDDTHGVQVWAAGMTSKMATETAAGMKDAPPTDSASAALAAEGEPPAAAAPAADDTSDAMLQFFWDRWGIRENMIHINYIDEIPRNPSGKTIYAKLTSE